MPPELLDTVSLSHIEVMRPGKWNGREYSTRDFDDMVNAFQALQGVYDPPAKLGHDDDQPLLANDGMPAVGWVSRLYREGSALYADFRDVPAKFAALLQAGGYRKKSTEVWFNIDIKGTTYPAVLKAVAWLGATAPAVKGMSDLFALYGDELPAALVYSDPHPAEETAVVESDLPGVEHNADAFDYIRGRVQDALEDKYPMDMNDMGMFMRSGPDDGPCPMMRDLYADRVIVTAFDGSTLYSIPYTIGANDEVALGDPAEVKMEYVPVPSGDGAAQNAMVAFMAEWDTAYVNNLPDSAFATILPGGTKDESGKTTPRSLRKLPHHTSSGAIDEPHLRNALSRLPQTDLPDAQKSRAESHLNGHAKSAGIGQENNAMDEIEFAHKGEPLIANIQEFVKSLDAGKNKKGMGSVREHARGLIAGLKSIHWDEEEEPEGDDDEKDGKKEKTPAGARNAEESMTDDDIRALLGLDATADVKQALMAMKATQVSLSDHQALQAQVAELMTERSQRTATELVDAAIRSGKVIPKMRDWAMKQAINNREDFETYVADSPVIVQFREQGGDDSANQPPEQLSEEAEKMAALLHTPREPLVAALAEQRAAHGA